MRKLLGTALVGGVIATTAVTATGVADASPPPLSLQCSIVTWPMVFLIEATGGVNSPFRQVAQSIGDAVCR